MSEQMKNFVGFLGLFLIVFALIFIAAMLTPKISKRVDKLIGKIFKKDKPDRNDDIYMVRSIYDKPGDKDNNLNKDGEEKNGEE